MRNDKDRREVDVDHFLPIGQRHLFERRAALNAGVVNKHIDRPNLLLDRGDAGLDLFRLGHIKRVPNRRPTRLGNLLNRERQRLALRSVEHDLCAGLGESLREGKPQPAR